jgi:hypothetical protein
MRDVGVISSERKRHGLDRGAGPPAEGLPPYDDTAARRDLPDAST